MLIFILILFSIGVLANVTMDELRFHFSRFFGKILPEKWFIWWNPSVSWNNKYNFRSDILIFIFSTALVWTTDAWHFFKMIFLSCFFLVILLLENRDLVWWQYLIELAVVHAAWGLVSWFGWTIYGWLSEKAKYMSDKKTRYNDYRKK